MPPVHSGQRQGLSHHPEIQVLEPLMCATGVFYIGKARLPSRLRKPRVAAGEVLPARLLLTPKKRRREAKRVEHPRPALHRS